jgi:hypothetical protein
MNRNGYQVGLIEFAVTIGVDYASHSSPNCVRFVLDCVRNPYGRTIAEIAGAAEPFHSRAAATSAIRPALDARSATSDEKAGGTDQQAVTNENQ